MKKVTCSQLWSSSNSINGKEWTIQLWVSFGNSKVKITELGGRVRPYFICNANLWIKYYSCIRKYFKIAVFLGERSVDIFTFYFGKSSKGWAFLGGGTALELFLYMEMCCYWTLAGAKARSWKKHFAVVFCLYSHVGSQVMGVQGQR